MKVVYVEDFQVWNFYSFLDLYNPGDLESLALSHCSSPVSTDAQNPDGQSDHARYDVAHAAGWFTGLLWPMDAAASV
jgi:hypothetical protein